MAGIHADRGDKSHRLISGERPELGMRVFTNDWQWATITKEPYAGDRDLDCGWYCGQWWTVTYDDGSKATLNCERMTTRKPN